MSQKNSSVKNLYGKLPKSFTIEINKAEEGGFWAKGKGKIKGVYTQGETLEELFEMLEDAIEVFFTE